MGQTVVIEDDRKSDVAGDFVDRLRSALPASRAGARDRWPGPAHSRGRGAGGLRPHARALAASAPRDQPARLRLPHGVPPLAEPLEAGVPTGDRAGSPVTTPRPRRSPILASRPRSAACRRGGEPARRCALSWGSHRRRRPARSGSPRAPCASSWGSRETTSGTWSRSRKCPPRQRRGARRAR